MQGQFLEETIRSVLLQGYPNIEYLVIDGGSRDDSPAVLEKYSPWLTYWRSEKDSGQADAINKGLERVTGEIVAYINSDDWYYPGAFAAVATRAAQHPEEHWWAGWVDTRRGERSEMKHSGFSSMPRFLGRAETLYQPGVFWRRRMLKDVPRFDPSLHYAFDHEYWVRALDLGYRPVNLESPLAYFRIHGESKTSTKQRWFMRELWQIARAHREGLTAAEWSELATHLRTYEADYLLTSVYSLLASGRRLSAIGYLIGSVGLYRHISPKKPIAGAILRTLITGTPPAWHGGDLGETGRTAK